MSDVMKCPFCGDETSPTALVCHSCGRDIAVPPELINERNQLIETRDRLRAELDAANAKLASRPGWRATARRLTRRANSIEKL
jgi:hypothetical protein